MLRIAGACIALMFASSACGEEGDSNPNGESPPPQDAATSVSPVETSDGSAMSDGDGSGGAPPEPPADAGTASSDAGQGSDARPPLVLEVPKASVMCGTTACDTANQVCCESWSAGRGFGSSKSCVSRERCYDQFEQVGDQNRAVPHECDGKEDCSGGLACCLVADGSPICELADIGMCTTKVRGPGGAGVCADAAECMLGSTRFIAPGVPLGLLACNDDKDCEDRPGTSCQPEQDNSLSTGTGIKARPYVKVCR